MINFESVSKEFTPAKSASKWTTGEVYIGFLKDTKTIQTPNGPTLIYTFEDADANGESLITESAFFASGGLRLANVQPGQLCKIVCQGKALNKKTNRNYVAFDVSVAKNVSVAV